VYYTQDFTVVKTVLVRCSMWMGRISLTPPSRMKELSDRLEEVRSRDATRPCGSFTFAYHYMCDYVGVPFSEEVAWVCLSICIFTT